jgi:hypothetical protein
MIKTRSIRTLRSNRSALVHGFIDGFGSLTHIYRPGKVVFSQRGQILPNTDRMNIDHDFAKIVRRVDGRVDKSRR